MTYDVPRWDLDVPRWHWPCDAEMQEWSSGEYVLAADAEAHEKAAVEAVLADLRTEEEFTSVFAMTTYQQAVCDCIAAVEEMLPHFGKYAGWQMQDSVVAALRALLTEGSEK